MSSVQNLTFESSWPYVSCENSTLANGKTISVKKVQQLQNTRLPLGVSVFGPQAQLTKDKPILSHHFVPNTYREDKFDKLSVIQSAGEQEGVDTPLYSKVGLRNRRDNGMSTNLSRFASPAHVNVMRFNQGSMTPATTKTTKRGSGHFEVEEMSNFSSYANKNNKNIERKKTITTPS